MAPEDQQPSGYCPRCDYPINPGRCPECGLEVAPERLAHNIRSIRRRRRILKGLRVLGVLLACFGAYRAILTPWLYPTALLLRLQGDENHWTTIELARRYGLKELSSAHAQRMFDQAIEVGRVKIPRDPYPIGVPIPAELECCVHLPSDPGIQGATLQYEFTAGIAGQPSPQRPVLRIGDLSIPNTLRWVIVEGVDSRSGGTYTVTSELKIRVLEYSTSSKLNPTPVKEIMQRQFARATSITLQAGPIDHFIVASYEPDPASAVTISSIAYPDFLHWESETAEVSRYELQLRYEGSSAPLIGDIWARVSDKGEFSRLEAVKLSREPGAVDRWAMIIESLEGIDSAATLDVRIVPDPLRAVQEFGVSGYYATTVERLKVPLERSVTSRAGIPP